MVFVLRRELHCSEDEILWEMSVPKLNKMLHAYYFMEGRDVRKSGARSEVESRFQRLRNLIFPKSGLRNPQFTK